MAWILIIQKIYFRKFLLHTEILMITFMADDHDVDINDGPDDADGRDPDENTRPDQTAELSGRA